MRDQSHAPYPNGMSVALITAVRARVTHPAMIEAMLDEFGNQIPKELQEAARHRIYVDERHCT